MTADTWARLWGSIGRLSNDVPKASQPEVEDDAEEGGGLHTVRPGEIYGSRYEVLRRLGHGQYSTVWLVRDQR